VSLAGLDDERDILEPSRRKFGAEDPDPARSTPPARDAPGLTGYQRRSAAAPAGIGVTVTAAGQDELDALCHLGGGQPAKRDRAPDELATGGRERRLELACEPRVAVHDEDIPVALGREPAQLLTCTAHLGCNSCVVCALEAISLGAGLAVRRVHAAGTAAALRVGLGESDLL
jgi:hypothetical protein